MPRVLAVVPARAGSVRLPGKNLKQIAGHSLIGWAVSAGRDAALVDDVVVSSDADDILIEGLRYGALPQRRPPELAMGEPGSMDRVLAHVLGSCGEVHDVVVLLQPTVPDRRPGLVDECIKRLIDTGADSVFTALPLHFVWMRRPPENRNGGGRRWHQTNCKGQRINRQDFVPADERWEEDGAVFVCRAELLRQTGCRIGGQIEIVGNRRVVDIDTAEDLAVAEALLCQRQRADHREVLLERARAM